MRYLIFELSMPSNNSWNGKWTGEKNYYAVGKSFSVSDNRVDRMLKKKYYTYDFGDGWRAGITIKEVDNSEYRKLVKKSKGFCGYEWMIKSIIENDIIKTISGV